MKVNLEFFFAKIVNNKVHYWKNELDISDSHQDPDKIVLQIVENELNEVVKIINENYIIHSTSWRFENNSIVITYLIYSDHLDFGNNKIKELPLDELVIATSSSHKVPRPEVITEENVISHAIRHLAFLVSNGNKDKYEPCLEEDTLSLLKRLHIVPAGKL